MFRVLKEETQMFKKITKKVLPFLLAVAMIFSTLPMGIFTASAAAKTVTVLDGQVSVTDSVGNGSVSNGTVKVTATGSLFGKANNTITVTNNAGKTVNLSFDYSVNSANSFTIDGSSASTSGTLSKVLDPGATISIIIQSKSGLSGTTVTLTLSNFSLVEAAASSNVTFNYDSNYGSVTVDGVTVKSGDVKNISVSGAALVATASNGVEFKGWVDGETGAILSTAPTYTITPASDTTIKAVFIGANSAPHFMLGELSTKSFSYGLLNLSKATYWDIPSGTHIFDDLNDAANASASSGSKGIVLMNNSTLPAGTYTIPSESVLLIPFNSNNTLYTTHAQGRELAKDEKHNVEFYRTLTMDSGANIILEGEMSLSAQHFYTQGAKNVGGAPFGNVSRVNMQEGSSITVNNGGSLYAYGFITGSGSVTAQNGASVYEYFQITDFRGGSQSTEMQNKVFPISQYYVQNIEVPLTLMYGAKEYSYTTITMQSSNFPSSVAFIGPSGSMFNLTSGYVVKRYDGSTDRLNIDLNGNMTVSPVEIKLSTTSKINSEDYVLPVNSNFSINVNSGSQITMNQNIALLPGSEIILKQDTNCTLGKNINIYIYDANEWGNYAGATNQKLIPAVYAPSRTYTRTEADLVDAKIQIDGTIDATNGFVYTTASGANVFSTGTGKVIVGKPGTETATYQVIQAADASNSEYPKIPITPAKFKNADGNYLNSADYANANTYTYNKDSGKWECENHSYSSEEIPPTCVEAGHTTLTCAVCGVVVKEEQAAKGHSYSEEFVIDKAATDLEKGSKSRHCANCDNKTDVTEIPALTKFEATVDGSYVSVTKYNDQIDGRFIIPDTLDGKTVTVIAEGAFKGQSGLTVVEIPFGVKNISATAFEGCDNLQAINYCGTIADWKNVEKTENAIPEGIRINYLGENIGDLDGNVDINADDMTYMISQILRPIELDEVQSYIYDTNADNAINLLDLVRLKKYLAEGTYLGHVTATPVEEKIAVFLASPTAVTFMSTAPAAITEPQINDYETFVAYFNFLEQLATYYSVYMDVSTDPVDLLIKYIRTGVDRYNSGSWGIMAGYENADFAKFIIEFQAANNGDPDPNNHIYLTALKNINNFYLPNGDYVDFGHMFGTMDMTYHNKGSINHADVGGWAGDLVDLLTAADEGKVTGTIEEMVAEISENYLNKEVGENGKFSQTDMYGDLDGLYLMSELATQNYVGDNLTKLMMEYFTEDLSMVDRAEYFIDNRMAGISLRSTLRTEVYNTYMGNMVIKTLEGTREFTSSNIADLRKACCYAFADYICKLAGDYVDSLENNYFEPFSTTTSTLAPGVTQEIKYATTADNKQMIYYIATADLTRDDVHFYANYKDNDPSAGWGMQTVIEQANAAQNKYGNPDSKDYIENYNVIVSTNGAGYNMNTGEPSGLLVMGGVEYHSINSNGFVGLLKDGTPVIGTTEEYKTIYKDKVQEGIAIFGATLVKDGKIVPAPTDSYFNDRASRTAIGITKTGKIVMMVLDGRQEPVSCGGSTIEIAQIMLDAGCVNAVNLDGGGSTTFVSKAEGADELAVVNRPSDGYSRSVSTSLMIVSTAPSSTAFDHAVLDSDYDYLTLGSSINLTASGVSATGNAAELPEGTSWAVSDTSIATIDQNGVLTAKANGAVDVYLMLGDEALAFKTIEVVVPDNISFTRNTLNAVYGAKVELPIKLTYLAKPVKYNVNDVALSVSNTAAGTFEGLTFIGNEGSNIKNVTITAALKTNAETLDTMNIALFSHGEAMFDFEQATGGDKEMAWDRVVSNSTTDDALNYYIVDSASDMVTSYTFAIDMSKISIPEQLADLTYMLPGAESGDASAWGFLCQLAERVSPLTEVKATIKFDSNFIVDYSKLTIVNDYFIHTATEFDEVTNTVTVTLKWIDRTEPIDTTLANPICIVSGIKLTPKEDAAWTADDKLSVVNGGEVTYDIYLRASALYTFALKEENQKEFGLYPFVNPDNESEKGGHYSAVYKVFNDKYTLIKTLKNGWYNEDGGFVFYAQGTRYYGIREVDGYYYDFGDNGVNIGQTKYTGAFYDSRDNAYYYSKLGELQSGWNMVGNDWHYYSNATKAAISGHQRIGGVYYDFEADGKLVSGVWVNTLYGVRYYYGPSYHVYSWRLIDGEWYYFRDGARLTGLNKCGILENTADRRWHVFDDNGALIGYIEDGLHEINGEIYYTIDGDDQIGLHKVGNDYYFFTYDGPAIKGRTYYAWETHCDLPCGQYAFGPDGRMANGIVKQADGYYCYFNGKVDWKKAGLHKIGDDYYFVNAAGKCVTGKYYAWATFCDLPCGDYYFGEDGKMLNGVVKQGDSYYCYFNGKLDWKKAGLHRIGDDYYFVNSAGKCVTGKYYAWATFCDLPCSEYYFGEDGKMLNGVVKQGDSYYCYFGGKLDWSKAGLHKIGDDYYFVNSAGKCVTGKYYAWATFCDLPCGDYYFGEDGKLLNGVVKQGDSYYCYFGGKLDWSKAGLHKIGDDYYFVNSAGKCVTGKYYAWATFCDLPCGDYYFGEDGKLLNGVVKQADGYYCYFNGKLDWSKAGLHKIGDDYYFVTSSGRCATGSYNAWATFCDLPCGTYMFGEDGKMLHGFVEIDGERYCYVNGKLGNAGLAKIDGDYYFINSLGKCVTGRYYAWATNCDLPCGEYYFGADGKMLDGFVTLDDGLYYFVDGKPGTVGLNYIDGYYYFILYGGKLIVNQSYYVWETNGILLETTYQFNELGQIVA